MRFFILGLLLPLIVTTATYAQRISGIVKDGQRKPFGGSTVSLLRANDSAIVKLNASKEDGSYSFINIKDGSYLIRASHVGYATVLSAPFSVSGTDVTIPALIINKATGDLKGVTVTSKKPMVEVQADKTILNVEGTINAVGSDALELLRKSPGVTVDKDENLSLSGKNGVQVYIDGRPTPLSGQDLSNYLKSLQSSQIEAIELITNPSAKYEAAGNAGIINIRLKKNKTFGTNGSVNGGWNIGAYAKYNGGFSLNHRDKKVNFFGNYSYNRGLNDNRMSLYRTVLDTLFDQHGTVKFDNRSHNFKAGIDYFINKKSTIGAIVNGNVSNPSINNYSRTPISYMTTNTINRILVADNTSTMKRNNINANLNYSYSDTSGRSLILNGDYGYYDINSNQMQPNFYYDPTGKNELSRVEYNMIAPTKIDIYSFKGDYEQNFKKGKLGVGGKVAFVKSDNDFQRYNVYTSGSELDKERSNHFIYKENINAAYLNYNRAFKGFMIQAGLRAENTVLEGISNGLKNINGSYSAYDSSFKRSYTNLFPSAAITFNKNPMKQVGLTYSRRIDRPAYQDLNPFEFKLDEYTFQRGNINLRPQYTNSFGITYTYKYRLNTTLNYSHVKDLFTQLIDTAEGSKAFLSKRNLATQNITSLNVTYPFQYKAYSVFGSFTTYYSHYNANFGTGRTINLNVVAANFFAQNSVKFAKTWTAELTGFYNSPQVYQGTFKAKSLWSIDAGLQKAILKGNGNIKASVSDILHTLKFTGTSDFAGQKTIVNSNWESRQFKLSFTYRFGNTQVKAARQRNIGAEEENKRVQSGGSTGIGQ